ncbi:MAG: hypothetical protein ACE5MI_08105 [Acidimicrobiia bacterium]
MGGSERRRVAGIGTILLVAMLMAWMIAPASATHVDPILVEGNPTCGSYSTNAELKLENGSLSNGVHTDGTLEVTISDFDGTTFDWSSNFGVDAVVAKGGPNANLYLYNPLATSDAGLHSPINPNTNQPYGLSHISFCYQTENATTVPTTVPPTTTAPPEPTTTVEQTTTTAPPEPTTTTGPQEATTTTEGTTTTTEGPTTTVAPTVLPTQLTTTTVASTETLPFTGFGSGGAGGIGAVLLVGGAGLLIATRRRSQQGPSGD